MQKTLDECRRAVLSRTPYVITQQRVEIAEIGKGRTIEASAAPVTLP